MNLYLLEIDDDGSEGGRFNSCVVCAKDKESARLIHPNFEDDEEVDWDDIYWVNSPDDVHVTLLGVADKTLDGVRLVCSSRITL
jgi:hypothetical protein